MSYTPHDRVSIDTGSDTPVEQSHRDQCDVNEIIRRFKRNGLLDHQNHRQPMYGDFTAASSLQESIELVTAAQDDFDSIPAKVRAAALNSPVQFLEMLSTPEGVAILEKAGLEVSEEGSPTPHVPPVAEPAPSDPSTPPTPPPPADPTP